MEFKEIAPGVKIPVLGLGTWGMGGRDQPDYSHDRQHIAAIRRAIKSGLIHIDTAELYAGGHAEELVGEAIKAFDRPKIFLTTKILPQYLFSPHHIFEHCRASLSRLGTDYIDLYLIHWLIPLVPLKRVMTTFDELVSQGLVRFIGVSNFSLDQLKKAQEYTKNKIVTNQVAYSLIPRIGRVRPDQQFLDWCRQNKILVTAYSPLGRGELAKNPPARLLEVAQKYGKTPVQVALRWLLDQENVIAIPKTENPEHLEEILGSLGWHLEKEDHEYLTNI